MSVTLGKAVREEVFEMDERVLKQMKQAERTHQGKRIR